MKHIKATSKTVPITAVYTPCCSPDNPCFKFWSMFMSEADADMKCTDKGKCTC